MERTGGPEEYQMKKLLERGNNIRGVGFQTDASKICFCTLNGHALVSVFSFCEGICCTVAGDNVPCRRVECDRRKGNE